MTPVIAIFDIGKTNKKLFLFDESYQIVWEKSENFVEIPDEDGDLCDDVYWLKKWVSSSLAEVMALPQFTVKAVNVSAYGASLVHIDSAGQPLTPLYSYLKVFPAPLQRQFFDTYGTEADITRQTASPWLGNLNSGLQLYRLRYEQPDVVKKLAFSLHLPQYISFLVNNKPVSDLTSIGCHTMLWDFDRQAYHAWVLQENLERYLAPIAASDSAVAVNMDGHTVQVGVGLHDSSAALIPYLASFQDSFVLISTGTWCLSMNPFNNNPLTPEELQYDCLNFMHYKGRSVKSARLFAGNEHEQQVKRLAAHFQVPVDTYKKVACSSQLIKQLRQNISQVTTGRESKKGQLISMHGSQFRDRDLSSFASYEAAYHQLMLDIMAQQLISTSLVLADSPVRRIFVDGGFGNNPIYMNLLAIAFPNVEVYAASVAQASALGAALAIHQHWNSQPIPGNCVALKKYTAPPVIR